MSDRTGGARPASRVADPPGPPAASEGNLAALGHVLGGILAVVGLLVNFLVVIAVVPALWLLLTARKRSLFLRAEARAALNFQITWVAVTLIFQVVSLVISLLLFGQGFHQAAGDVALSFWLVSVLIAAFDLIVSVLAMRRARRGGGFRYPLSLPFVK